MVEELGPKVDLLKAVGDAAAEADLATTTSSLSLDELGPQSGHAERVFGLHPFNPVVRMELIELCIPTRPRAQIRPRARAWCESIGKTVVEVPNEPGFVVNRLLFPYLFDAVRLMEQTGMEAEDVDRCMTLGANYPMGPLALLDLIGVDVAVAIGEALYADSGEEHHRPPGPADRTRRTRASSAASRAPGSTSTTERAAFRLITSWATVSPTSSSTAGSSLSGVSWTVSA